MADEKLAPFGAHKTRRGWVVYNTATGRPALGGRVFADQLDAVVKASELNDAVRRAARDARSEGR